MDEKMMKALEADGEKLRQLTGDDHGPLFIATTGYVNSVSDMLAALGTALSLITKHGLAVDLAKSHPEDYARLEAIRAAFAHAKA